MTPSARTLLRHATRHARGLTVSIALSGFALSCVAQSVDTPPKPMTRSERADRMQTAPTETFFLKNGTSPNYGNEVLTGLRVMLEPDVKLYLLPSEDAIIVHGLPSDIALARTLITTLDRLHPAFRISLTLTETDGSRPVSVEHAALTLERGQRGTLKRGMRLPVVTGSAGNGSEALTQVTYLDVGMNIDLTLYETSSGGSLKFNVEHSRIGEDKSPAGPQDPVIQQTVVQGVTVLTTGKPAMLFTADVPGTTHKLSVEAVAEPVR